jgi:hypothetical protein
MQKSTRIKPRLDPQLTTVVTAAIIVLIALVSAAAIGKQSMAPAPRATPTPALQAGLPPDGHTITITGQYVCLPHKDTTGPQTDECAYGLKDDHGVYYGLSDPSGTYAILSTASIGKRIQLTGTFARRDNPTYPSVGIITITAADEPSPQP